MVKYILALFVLFTVQSYSQNKNANVLNFEEDVIEGERKAPNLFIQLDVGTPNLDTVLFQRNNFNDYHAVDKSRRPQYQNVGKEK